MGEIFDFCLFDRSINYSNRIYLDKFNDLFRNRECEVLVSEFLLNSYPKEVKLLINLDKDNILKLEFNYLLQFYGYTDRWQSSVIEIFCQEEVIHYAELYRDIKLTTFTLYDKKNDFIIKSKNMYQWQ